VQQAENRQSRHIFHERHDRQYARGDDRQRGSHAQAGWHDRGRQGGDRDHARGGYGDRGGYAQAGWQNQGRQWGGDRSGSMTRDPGESRRGGGHGAPNGQRYARR
jgi:hypothetical protein